MSLIWAAVIGNERSEFTPVESIPVSSAATSDTLAIGVAMLSRMCHEGGVLSSSWQIRSTSSPVDNAGLST